MDIVILYESTKMFFIKYLESFYCETTRITDIGQFASFDSLKVVRLRFATSEK